MIVYIIIIYNVITQIHQPGPHTLPYQNTHPQMPTFWVVQVVTRHFASRDPLLFTMYVTGLFSCGIVFPQEAWGPQTLVSPGTLIGPREEIVIFSMSLLFTVIWGVLSHTPVAGAMHGIKWISHYCRGNVSSQGMKKQGGRGSKFAEHGCETKQKKIVVGRFTDLSTKYKFKMARMYSKLATQHVWACNIVLGVPWDVRTWKN